MNVFEQALLNTLMGMGTVFAVLIFISLLISLFVYIPSIERALKNRSSKKEKNYIYYTLNTSVVEEVMLWLSELKGGNHDVKEE